MDDIAPGMDWAKFGRFRALCDRYGVRPLIGVVPDNRDAGLEIDPPREDFFETVKELAHSGWSVAMHGCHHVYTSKSGGLFPLNHLSEFAGLSYEKQSELIRRGRQVLTANGIATFTSLPAPWQTPAPRKRYFVENSSPTYTPITEAFST